MTAFTLQSTLAAAGITHNPWQEVARRLAPHPLFPFQARVLSEGGLLDGRSLLAVSPTGTGKSALGDGAVIGTLARGHLAVWLVPTRALARERADALAAALAPAGYRVVASSRDDRDSDEEILLGRVDVVVAVYEKMRTLFLRSTALRQAVSLIVVDEAQILEEDERGPGAHLLLRAWRLENPALQILALSSALQNPESLAREFALDSHASTDRVVPRRSGFIDPAAGSGWWKDESTGECGELSFLPFDPADGQEGLARSGLIDSLEKPLLLFAPTRREAALLAEALADGSQRPPQLDASLREELAEEPRLAHLLALRVGLHTADLTRRQRAAVESLLHQGALEVCVATTTLAEGLNLGARTVVVLPGVERLAGSRRIENLLGRAGRPGMDCGYAFQFEDAHHFVDKLKCLSIECERQNALESIAFLLTLSERLSTKELHDRLGSVFAERRAVERAVLEGLRLGLWMRELEGDCLQANECTRLVAGGGIPIDAVAGWRTILRRFRPSSEPATLLFLALSGPGCSDIMPLSPEERQSARYPALMIDEMRRDTSPMARYLREFLADGDRLPRRVHQAAKAVCAWLASSRGESPVALAPDFGISAGLLEELLRSAHHYLWILEEMARTLGHAGFQIPRPEIPSDIPAVKIECLPEHKEESDSPLLVIYKGSTGLVAINGGEVRLTRIQFRMLELLARHAGQGLPYERIEAYVWPDAKVERQQVSFHRKNLETRLRSAAGLETSLIETHATWGLRLAMEPEQIQFRDELPEPVLLERPAEVVPINSIAREVCL